MTNTRKGASTSSSNSKKTLQIRREATAAASAVAAAAPVASTPTAVVPTGAPSAMPVVASGDTVGGVAGITDSRDRINKYVGIVVKKSNFFTNGNVQNAWFIGKIYEEMGYTVKFLTEDREYTRMEPFTDPVECYATPGYADYDKFSVVIFTSYAVAMLEAIVQFKRAGVRFVYYNCGNYYTFHQEEFVFGRIRDTSQYFQLRLISNFVDEIWTFPGYSFMNSYVETLSYRKVREVPHLWTPEIIRATGNDPSKMDEVLEYKPLSRSSGKFEIIIMEPNVNVTKTGWVPLVIAEHTCQKIGGALEKVHYFCHNKNPYSEFMICDLQISRQQKIVVYQRTPTPLIFAKWAESEHVPIFVCHQNKNPLNYLHYELMYYGFPVVHNSELLRDHGYYYEGEDIEAAYSQIVRIMDEHVHNAEGMRRRAREYLEETTMLSDRNKEIFRGRLMGVIASPQLVTVDVRRNEQTGTPNIMLNTPVRPISFMLVDGDPFKGMPIMSHNVVTDDKGNQIVTMNASLATSGAAASTESTVPGPGANEPAAAVAHPQHRGGGGGGGNDDEEDAAMAAEMARRMRDRVRNQTFKSRVPN